MSVCLICPECGIDCNALWAFRYCMGCWYITCGGDRAANWVLAVPPSIMLPQGPRWRLAAASATGEDTG